ncbi:NADH-ubiquinone oxidoreductase 20.8 kDa subunit [Yarrowia sp. C11]|nr:NADH-ubiquinone oxidoreductase 20.8 kDa subunit [Yarrowia sp. E02]KAG5369924.1 NADH-ubiquinone oxidoreductase 20.8 kDa subunit [Yarrowia sp. C11]
MPDNVPDVVEVGATSAPLLSASYFIGAKCKPYNDDFMLCREEAQGSGAVDCLKEGRRVTRCAVSVIEDINKSCLDQFRLHWQCLEQNNHQLSGCRQAEALLNKCVFTNLNLEKKIPGLRPDEEPVFLKKDPWIKPAVDDFKSVRAYAEAKKDGTL